MEICHEPLKNSLVLEWVTPSGEELSSRDGWTSSPCPSEKALGVPAEPCGKCFQCFHPPVDKQRTLLPRDCPSALRPFQPPKKKNKFGKQMHRLSKRVPPPWERWFFAPGCILCCVYARVDSERSFNVCDVVRTLNKWNFFFRKDQGRQIHISGWKLFKQLLILEIQINLCCYITVFITLGLFSSTWYL